MHHHKWDIANIDNLMPWEKEIYVNMLVQFLKEEERRMIWKEKGGYIKKDRLSSFVAAFPIHNPEYAVLVMIDEPKGNATSQGYATGGWGAAPVVGAVVRRIAPVLGLRPGKADEASRETLAIEVSKKSGRERRVAAH